MTDRQVVCKVCGCHLELGDVKQLAMYYHQNEPSMVAVQYVCPRCGGAEWHRYEPGDLSTAMLGGEGEWAALAGELGLVETATAERPAPHAVVVEVGREYDLARSITLDEYIDFCCRVNRLAAGDLAELGDSVL